MTKIRKGNKETRKTPKLSPKAKKAAKLARRHDGDTAPFIPVVER